MVMAFLFALWGGDGCDNCRHVANLAQRDALEARLTAARDTRAAFAAAAVHHLDL